MSNDHGQKAYEIIWLVRRLFRALAARADLYLADLDLSAADRAVMEFLYPAKALSVPDIARRYKVSRQHVQVTVNGLVDRGLVRRVDNPHHKRSWLIRLSRKGKEGFDEIRRNEVGIVDELFADVPTPDLDTTLATLQSLYRKLDKGESR